MCDSGARYPSDEDERAWLEGMRFSLRIGHVKTLRTNIELRGTFLANSPSDDVRAEYGVILRQAEAAFEIERKHGAGCLLRLDDPAVLALTRRSPGCPPLVSDDEVKAAARYRSLKPCERQ